MKLRVARHTNDLDKMVEFYVNILGLEQLGSFTDHDGYHGVFIGLKNQSWHLEFTTSSDAPIHQADGDDLLVFYCASALEKNNLAGKFRNAGYQELAPKNPYWTLNGTCFNDPDGFGIILSTE